jgi:hypothetical protein
MDWGDPAARLSAGEGCGLIRPDRNSHAGQDVTGGNLRIGRMYIYPLKPRVAEHPRGGAGSLDMNVGPRWKAALVVTVACALVATSLGILAMTAHEAAEDSSITSSSTSESGKIVVGSFSSASSISSAFWGVDVAALQRFNSADAGAVAATPVNYIRFPGGLLGEEYNYLTGIVTAANGAQSKATTSAAEFVSACKQIGCHAIMQLPVEINSPSTAASYVTYIVHTLGFQPAYWEFGNSPAAWTHFGVPWTEWKSKVTGNITPLPFANLVHAYIAAVLAVDPSGKFIALGAGEGSNDYAKPWVEDLAKIDGHELSGISVHNYVIGGPSNPTDSELFANLNGFYSLPAQVTADRSYIRAACPSCTNMDVFVTEINAAETGSYMKLLTSFAGTLYLAADTVQGLSLKAANLDWFCYDCGYPGAWSQNTFKWQMQYYLFTDVLTHLKSKTLATTVTGPSTFYGIATYDSTGLALLLVNVNTGSSVNVDLSQSGFILDRAGVTQYLWQDGSSLPKESSVSLSSSENIPALSILLLTVGPSGTKSPGNDSTVATGTTSGSANSGQSGQPGQSSTTVTAGASGLAVGYVALFREA